MSSEAREARIVACLPMVTRYAWSFARRYRGIEFEDFRGAGYLGLLQADAVYEPARGEFGALAARRVPGAMLDLLRTLYCGRRSKAMWPLEEAPEPMSDSDAYWRTLYEELIEGLKPQSRRVVEMRKAGETFQAIGAQVGVGECRARQVWNQTCELLRQRVCDGAS